MTANGGMKELGDGQGARIGGGKSFWMGTGLEEMTDIGRDEAMERFENNKENFKIEALGNQSTEK